MSYIASMTSTAAQILQITLNGEGHTMAPGSLVSDLVQQLVLDPRKVAIEKNLTIIRRDAYATTPIMDGDRIEIVGFIGGG